MVARTLEQEFYDALTSSVSNNPFKKEDFKPEKEETTSIKGLFGESFQRWLSSRQSNLKFSFPFLVKRDRLVTDFRSLDDRFVKMQKKVIIQLDKIHKLLDKTAKPSTFGSSGSIFPSFNLADKALIGGLGSLYLNQFRGNDKSLGSDLLSGVAQGGLVGGLVGGPRGAAIGAAFMGVETLIRRNWKEISGSVNSGIDKAQEAYKTVKDKSSSIWHSAVESASDIGDNFKRGFNIVQEAVIKFKDQIVEGLSNFSLYGVAKSAVDLATWVMDSVSERVKKAFEKLMTLLGLGSGSKSGSDGSGGSGGSGAGGSSSGKTGRFRRENPNYKPPIETTPGTTIPGTKEPTSGFSSIDEKMSKMTPEERKAYRESPQFDKDKQDQLWQKGATFDPDNFVAAKEETNIHWNLKNLIAQKETGTSGPESYDTVYAHGKWLAPPKAVTEMTIAEVLEYQRKGKAIAQSPAYPVGRYQIVESTLRGLAEEFGLDPNTTKYDKYLQEAFADTLLKRRGNNPDSLRKEWDSLRGVSDAEILQQIELDRVAHQGNRIPDTLPKEGGLPNFFRKKKDFNIISNPTSTDPRQWFNSYMDKPKVVESPKYLDNKDFPHPIKVTPKEESSPSADRKQERVKSPDSVNAPKEKEHEKVEPKVEEKSKPVEKSSKQGDTGNKSPSIDDVPSSSKSARLWLLNHSHVA